MIWRYQLPVPGQRFTGNDPRWEVGVTYTVLRQDVLEEVLLAAEQLASACEQMADNPRLTHALRNELIKAVRKWRRKREKIDGQEEADGPDEGARQGQG